VLDLGRSDDVRKRNRARILAVLRRDPELSRKQISEKTGLSASTVSAITSELLDEAMLVTLRSEERSKLRRGRPQISLSLNPNAALVASAVLQLDRIAVALSDYSGNTVMEVDSHFPARQATREQFTATFSAAIAEALSRKPAGSGALERIEIGVQGVTDVDGSAMLWSPISRHRNIALKADLEEVFGVPVRVSNDCSMIALALHWREPDHFSRDYGAVLLSHGIGMGLMLNGTLVSGIRSSATEFGHLSHIPGGALCRCGRRGCIEAYAGDYAIVRHAENKDETSTPRNDISRDDIDATLDAARQGNASALEAFRQAGEALGTGLADMFALVDPFPVALVGYGTIAFEFIEKPLRDAIGMTNLDIAGDDIEISCFPDEKPLIMEGCTMTALLKLDQECARSTPQLQEAGNREV
jgi:predicted NBD/HSP70 family sugar kinase